MTRAGRGWTTGLALAALLSLSAAPARAESLRQPEPPGAATATETAMADLVLDLAAPTTPVMSGEDFTVAVTVRNAGPAPVAAPPEGDESAFEVILKPLAGGEPQRLSDRIREQALHPTDLFPPAPGLERDDAEDGDLGLAPGETRRYQLRPARLTVEPFEPGRYAMTVAIEGEPGVPGSAPATLVVEPARPVALSVVVVPGRADAFLAFIHEGDDGGGRLYQGLAPEEKPYVAAMSKVADIGDARAFAQARPDEAKVGGVSWVAWLDAGGRLGAALSYRSFLAGVVAPVDLGLRDATLQRTGWQDGENDGLAAFVALGAGEAGVELALIRLDADAGWSATVTRTPLGLDALPVAWRLTRWRDGGWALVSALADGDGARIRLDLIDAAGAVTETRDLGSSSAPFAAMSVPDEAHPGETVDLLFGPQRTERFRMQFLRAPLNGAPPSSKAFLVPDVGGMPPTGWAVLDGAPDPAFIAATLDGKLLGLRLGAETVGGVLAEGLRDPRDLQVIQSAVATWVVWSEVDRGVRGVVFEQ